MAADSEGAQNLLSVLLSASEELRSGEMLHSDLFNLSSVMNATVIGDPRLDAGLTPESPTKVPDATVRTDLNAGEVLAVMDTLLCAEATWQSGAASLAQTVYTCCYLFDPERIGHMLALSAFCTAVKVTTRLISDMAFETRVCEEEDLLAYMFDFGGAARGLPDAAAAVSQLTLAEEALTALHRQPGNGAGEDAQRPALLSRLRFRRLLLQAFQKLAGHSKQQLEAARKPLAMAAAEFEKLQLSHPTAAAAIGFDADLNRALLGPAPPRPVRFVAFDAAVTHFSRLLRELGRVCDVTKVSGWTPLKHFLEAWAVERPGPIPRMAMARALGVGGGSEGPRPWAPHDAMLRGAIGLPRSSEQPASPELAVFLTESVSMPASADDEMASSMPERDASKVAYCAQCKCMNRARQRRRHRSAIRSWADLLQHAAAAEASGPFREWLAGTAWEAQEANTSGLESKGPLVTWVELECTQQLLQHLMLGFELGCYLPYEFCLVYWYCDYLCGVISEDCGTFVKAAARVKASQSREKGKKAQRHAVKAVQPLEMPMYPAAVHYHEGNAALLLRKACQGAMRLAAGLSKAGIVAPRPAPFNTEEQLFEQRFFAFSQLHSPAYLTYEDYAAAMDLASCSASDLLVSATENYKDVCATAKAITQSGQDLRSSPRSTHDLEPLAMRNLVALRLLLASATGEAAAMPGWQATWDFSHHSFFPVLCLKRPR